VPFLSQNVLSPSSPYRVVIPARYGSTRLPGKPLLSLAGRPMIQWVYERARRSAAHEIIVATDDERIAQVARGFGATVCMTAYSHASGTDRIAEVATRARWPEGDIVVNLQGDEPLLPEALLDQVAGLLQARPDAQIATLAVPLRHEAEWRDPNVVKVVTDLAQQALYFSRAQIPFARDGASAGDAGHEGHARAAARRHVGLYAYRVGALRRIAALPASTLERLEQLEQLRALEHGMRICVADALVPPGPDVNSAQDLEAVAALLAAEP
jgi:3-deoxy-manno-octulosonate cytidylyltransferase (CMP-KDO synthetase)